MRICVSCVLRLYVCLFFFLPSSLTVVRAAQKKDDSVHFIRKTLPSDSECTLSSIAFFFFVNLGWCATVEGFFSFVFVLFPLPSPLLFLPVWFWLCILPQTRRGERAKYRGQLFKQAEIFCASIQIISTRDSLPSSCSDACDCDWRYSLWRNAPKGHR